MMRDYMKAPLLQVRDDIPEGGVSGQESRTDLQAAHPSAG